MIDTGDATLDAIVAGLLREVTEVDTTEITYTFELTAALDGDPEYSRFNQAMIDRHMAVFSHLSELSGATFREADLSDESADYYFAFRENVSTAYVVEYEGGRLHVHNPDRDDPELGSYVDHLVLHELGHGFGLEHGHDYNGLPPEFQGHSWSVMSYRAHPFTTELTYGDSHGPETYMPADIAAIQYLYGADFETEAGDTVYTVDFNTGELFVDGEGQGVPVNEQTLRTIWDGAGEDTLDLSNAWSRLEIDLRPGAFTSFGAGFLAIQGRGSSGDLLFAEGNLANPYLYQGNRSSLLENAIGGLMADKIIGNVIDNRLEGRGGNDSLFGMAGDDELLGGGGDDLVVDGLGDTDAQGNAGDDYLVALSGDGVLDGGAGNDILIGGNSNDHLRGGNGNDVLRGDAGQGLLFGSDTLEGGAGDDTLMGGRGADQFIFRPNDGADMIGGFAASQLGDWDVAAVFVDRADFLSGVDQIVLAGFSDVTADNVMSFVSLDSTESHAVFSAEQTTVTFFGVGVDQLSQEDFVFL